MRMNLRIAAWVGAAALTAAAPAAAVPMLIDFEADPVGGKANGFNPIGHPGVHFSDTVGSGLFVGNFGVESGGTKGLAVFNDTDGGILNIAFDLALTFLGLSYGNDDPNFSNAGDLAVLTAYLGAAQVGQVTQVFNRDDIMNQTITIGGLFDRVTFAYTNPALAPFTGGSTNTGLIEIVDSIEYEAVPEPGTLLLIGTGLAGLAMRRRRQLSN